MAPRIAPLSEPYAPAVAAQLASMMPKGAPPIRLFRTFAHNLPMTEGLAAWGRYYLSPRLSLSLRDRELVIDRTTARCGCEYEWGVHMMTFADRVGLTREQAASLVHGGPGDECWTSEREQLLILAVDALHERSDIDDALWTRLVSVFDELQLLDLLLLCGWYHAVSFAARAARVPHEPGAPRFTDFLPITTARPTSDMSTNTGGSMPKGYWVSVYPTIEDPESLEVYNHLAGLAVAASGGRVLASIGSRVDAHEAGIAERVVLIEFDSFDQAVAARASAAYQKALAELPDGFERDFRIVEGLT